VAKARKRPPRNARRRNGRGVVDPVPVGPIRDMVLEMIEDGVSYAEVCARIGWVDPSGKADTTRLQRRLGLRRESGNRKTLKNGEIRVYGGGPPHGLIAYERAVEICRGLGRDPVDVRDPVTGESLL
jgi:hypothetical protein